MMSLLLRKYGADYFVNEKRFQHASHYFIQKHIKTEFILRCFPIRVTLGYPADIITINDRKVSEIDDP